MCEYETERKRMRIVEINYDHNPLGEWTQASAKFPIPTALPGPEVTVGRVQEVQHFFSQSTSIFCPLTYMKIKNGNQSLRYLYLFAACVTWLLVSMYWCY